jgi:hypothetical protein
MATMTGPGDRTLAHSTRYTPAARAALLTPAGACAPCPGGRRGDGRYASSRTQERQPAQHFLRDRRTPQPNTIGADTEATLARRAQKRRGQRSGGADRRFWRRSR